MKKTMIALAAIGAMAGAAHAQSNVTMYGVVDMFVGESTTKTHLGGAPVDMMLGTTPTWSKPGMSLTSGGLSGSRWGLRGSEDLGGGLKANFQLESAISADTGASTGFNGAEAVQPITINTTGDDSLDLGTMGKLLAPVVVEGKTYYYWDRSGDGTTGSADAVPQTVLSGIFKYDANGVEETEANKTGEVGWTALAIEQGQGLRGDGHHAPTRPGGRCADGEPDQRAGDQGALGTDGADEPANAQGFPAWHHGG